MRRLFQLSNPTASDATTGKLQRVDLILIALPLALYLILSLPLRTWIIDDAGISFAYARNFALGQGLVSQPGVPPVEGFTNFLWVILMAPFFVVRLFDPYITSKVVSFVLVGVTFFSLYRSTMLLTGGRRLIAAVVLIFLAINTSYLVWTVSGLENPLYAALVALLVYYSLCILETEGDDMRTAAIAAALVTAIALTRPDGILYAVIPIIAFWARARRTKSFLRSIVSRQVGTYFSSLVVLMGGFLVFRRLYFGDFVPNTYYAKRGPGLSVIKQILRLRDPIDAKLHDVTAGLFGEPAALILAIASFAALFWLVFKSSRRSQWAIIVAGPLLSLFAYLAMHDSNPEFRLATPFFPLVFMMFGVTIGLGLIALPLAKWLKAACGIGFVLFLTAMVFVHQMPRYRAFVAGPPVAFASVKGKFAHLYDEYAHYLGLENASVLLPDIGATIYYSNLRVYDLAGLCDRVIGRTMMRDQLAFYDYIFVTAKPTFIHTHGTWTYRSRLEEDVRFRRDYEPITEYEDAWVASFSKKQTGEALTLHSGDYIRRDAIQGKQNLIENIRQRRWRSGK